MITFVHFFSRRTTKPLLASLLVLSAMVLTIELSHAQRVQPMVFELATLGNESSQSLRIDNTTQNPLTMEFTASKIILDEFGNESREPADDDFLIYPPQTLVPAGQTQVVKVKYVGDPSISQSQAYRVSAHQLAVNLDREKGAGVGILINFDTLVNVVPPKAKANLVVSELSAADGENWNLVIQNTGNKFVRLSTTYWDVSSTDENAKIKPMKIDTVGQLVKNNLVAPNSSMRLSIPAIASFKPESTSIDIVGE